jgi:hypothetical protein
LGLQRDARSFEGGVHRRDVAPPERSIGPLHQCRTTAMCLRGGEQWRGEAT